jgi:WD40 repeat protein
MDFSHKIHLSHFQLRNLLACASRDHVFYASRSKILQWNPTSGPKFKNPIVAMDLTEPTVQAYHAYTGGIQISTLTTAHNVLVAGGFCGEYSLVNLRAPKTTKHTEGLITYNENGITNHVQVHLSRNSSLPLAAFASNDNGMRILDINTNKFIAEHKYDHAINCSAISPDQRLRVLVGDTRQVMICNSETGEILQSLDGHRDYGFACDWADDGWTVATGNQDMQVKIWDARKWISSQGLPSPVATVPAEMAGVRKLKFSPLGSGKRVLLAAEPADFISVIDAQTFTSKQTLNFFGEIGGLDFTNEGQDFIVANCDGMRGGLMEFERSDLARAGLYNLEESQQNRSRSQHRRKGEGYDWKAADEDILSHQKSRGTKEQRWRKPAALGITMDYF